MNNLKSHSRCSLVRGIAPVMLIALSAVSASPQDSTLLLQKRALNARLDSLEVEKQTLKRKGKPIGDLEEISRQILDSLTMLKRQVAEGVANPSIADPVRPSKAATESSFFRPQGLFDWIIVVVGSVAVISGIVLVLGILRTMAGPKRPRSPRPAAVGTPPPAVQQTSRNEEPEERPVEPLAATYSDPLSRLRRRIQDDEGRIASRDVPNVSSLPFPLPKTSTDTPSDIDARVVQAAREGLDIQEISRKLHISADQVALILKVAKSQPR